MEFDDLGRNVVQIDESERSWIDGEVPEEKIGKPLWWEIDGAFGYLERIVV